MFQKMSASKMTPRQKIILLEFIKQNDDLRRGKFGPNFTKPEARELWRQVTNVLNDVAGGAEKTWHQWRKTWLDLKKSSKAYLIKKNKFQICPDEVPGFTPSSDYEEILKLIYPSLEEEFNSDELPIEFVHIEDEFNNSQVTLESEPCGSSASDDATSPAMEQLKVDIKPHFHTRRPDKKINKKFSKTVNLENSSRISQSFYKLTEEKIRIKQRYYERKLELQERQIQILEELVPAVKIIANTLQDLI